MDLAASGRPGHGPVHLLLESDLDLGFAWESAEEEWLRPGLPPLSMLSGLLGCHPGCVEGQGCCCADCV